MKAGEKAKHGRPVLVTGATGYVGGRLVPRLLDEGFSVRVLARDPGRLQGRSWSNEVDIALGDVLRPETLATAMSGVDTAYYFIHSMRETHDFHRRDLQAARNFAQAAASARVKRIIYLGGMGDPEDELSEHLHSRQATGEALREAGVPVTEFRAAVIVGSGSLSFEMVRNLTERLPVMVCPRWVFSRIQPIAIGDVIAYMVEALDVPESSGRIIEIGGADVLTYADMMHRYARVRGLRRLLIPVPVLTPRLSSYWIHWTTPIPAEIAAPLIEGLHNEVIVRDDTAQRLFPRIAPIGYDDAVRRAVEHLESGQVETAWSDALSSSQGDLAPVVLRSEQGIIIERRQQLVPVAPESLFRSFTGLGGDRGWLYANFAWSLRGLVDRLFGGVGLRRGRRHPDQLRVGDAVDFWRVEEVRTSRSLRLRAEMRLPGRAWLQFDANPASAGQTLLVQSAYFAPKGLFGLIYWYVLYPVHALIFANLIKRIARRAMESSGASAKASS